MSNFFAGNSYLQVLIKLAAFAAANPQLFKELWTRAVALYNAGADLVNKARERWVDVAPVEGGTLQMLAPATDEELDAEDRLSLILHPASEGSQALRQAGNFRKILAFLATTEIGRALLDKLLGEIGS